MSTVALYGRSFGVPGLRRWMPVDLEHFSFFVAMRQLSSTAQSETQEGSYVQVLEPSFLSQIEVRHLSYDLSTAQFFHLPSQHNFHAGLIFAIHRAARLKILSQINPPATQRGRRQ